MGPMCTRAKAEGRTETPSRRLRVVSAVRGRHERVALTDYERGTVPYAVRVDRVVPIQILNS